jgi:3-hydroxyacyl-CoA dehydrogenase
VNGKRCLGGILELLVHCHYVVSVEDAALGMPEVTLPVVPGMEGCHWPFRKAGKKDWPKLLDLLLSGRPVKAKQAVGWLIDFAGPLEESLQTAWKVAFEGDGGPLARRGLIAEPLKGMPAETALPNSGNPATEAARKAILDCVMGSCGVPASEALTVQAKHSAGFMNSRFCREGMIGADCAKVMNV